MLIPIMGLGGSGKTTILKSLKQGDYLGCATLTLNPPRLIKQMLLPLLPIHYVITSWIDYLKKRDEFRVTDRSYYDKLISLAVHNRLPLQYLMLLSYLLPKPDHVIYLDCSPEECYKRKKEHDIEFIKKEQIITLLFLMGNVPDSKITWVNTEDMNENISRECVKCITESMRAYGDPYAWLIIDKDVIHKQFLLSNFHNIFDKCWNNRMIFHYFDWIPEIQKMYREYEKKKNRTLNSISKTFDDYKIIKKSCFKDIETDIDIYIENETSSCDVNIPGHLTIDIHNKLEYMDIGYSRLEDASMMHSVIEMGTLILRDFDELDHSWRLWFSETEFPRKLSIWQMLFVCSYNIFATPKILHNYFRVWRAWRKGKLPYYEPEFTKEEIFDKIWRSLSG